MKKSGLILLNKEKKLKEKNTEAKLSPTITEKKTFERNKLFKSVKIVVIIYSVMVLLNLE